MKKVIFIGQAMPRVKKHPHDWPSLNSWLHSEKKRLQKTIKDFNPDIVVTIGKLLFSHCIGREVKLLNEFIGKSFKINPYGLLDKELLIIPFPHPSGASTWYKKLNNRKLLEKAFEIFKSEAK